MLDMAIKLNLNAVNSYETEIHSIPCHISYNGEAATSNYFAPYVQKHPNDSTVLVNTFRGRPLYGKEQSIPENYVGMVLEESNAHTDSCERNLKATNIFGKFIYWNWDQLPSENDKISQALDWVHLAEVIHSPVKQSSQNGCGDENSSVDRNSN